MIEIFQNSLIEFIKIFPILAFAIIGAEIVSKFIPKKDLKKSIRERKRGLFIITGIGLFAPGPLIAYVPALNTLKKKGLPLSYISSFIAAHTLIGPMRVLIEIYYFSVKFFAVKTVLAFIMSFCTGLIFMVLEKKKVFS